MKSGTPPAIITLSRRTDAAEYLDQFLAAAQQGFIDVPNPYSGKLYRVSLLPRDVLLLTLWTKDPARVLSRLDEILAHGYRCAFFISMTGYPRYIEQKVPLADVSARAVQQLATRLSPDALWWRYDPVLFTKTLNEKWHIDNFTRLCALWRGNTRRVIFSLAHIDGAYAACRRSLTNACLSANDLLDMNAHNEEACDRRYHRAINLFAHLKEIALAHEIPRAEVCCSPRIDEKDRARIAQGSCLSMEYIEKIVPHAPSIARRPTRKGGMMKKYGYADCTCVASRDIGEKKTCTHGCVYCYANR